MSVETIAAIRLLTKPLNDLYEAGKDQFKKELVIWQNDKARTQLAQKILAYDKIKTIWQKNKDVRLSRIYYPSHVSFPEGITKQINSLNELPKLKNLVIQGTVGQGKSVFLRHLCIQELRQAGSGRIPIFIEFRSIDAKDGLPGAIRRSFDALGFKVSDELLDFYAASGSIVLLLDAFDELADDLVNTVFRDMEILALKYPLLQMIVTSRPNRAIQNSGHFSVISLAPLSQKDFDPFLEKINVNASQRQQLIAAINQSSSGVSGLLTTPLMLTLVVMLYAAEKTIPSELPEFFEALFQTVFTAHDKQKPGLVRHHKTGLSERKLQKLFEAFCFMGIQKGFVRSLDIEQFNNAFDLALKYSDGQCSPEDFRSDITQVACLMQEEGFDITFLHQSIQEYYAAAFIRHCHDQAAEKFYMTMVVGTHYHRWAQVQIFLSQIDPYRWAKFFKIPMIEEALSSLGVTSNGTNLVTIDGVKLTFKEVIISYNYDRSSDQFTVISAGPYAGRFHICLPELDGDAFVDIIDSANDLSEKYKTKAKLAAEKEDLGKRVEHIKVPFEHALSTKSLNKLLLIANKEVKALRLERKELMKLVAQEESKVSIFN